VGIDISSYAIARAGEREFDMSTQFTACELSAYSTAERFDAIVFNEVLYYLDPEEAGRQVVRFGEFLSPDGVLIVSLKEDPKSRAILRRITRDACVLSGLTYQQQTPARFGWRNRRDAKMPAYLLLALRPVS
jgi:predicted TPR repeat methyltransferase